MRASNLKKIYLSGGFGNILFQLVAYLKFQQEGYDVYFIKTLVEKNCITKLLNWKIHSETFNLIFKELDIKIFRKNNFSVAKDLIKGKISSIITRPYIDTYFFAKGWNEEYLIDNNLFFGYFQDKYFLERNKDNVKIIVNSLIHLMADFQDNKYDVVVHFRLGDSLWAVNNSSYYLSVKNQLKYLNNPFLIVTDSPREAELYFQDLGEFLVLNNDANIDFGILITAKMLFIAPSTFSYWASLCLNNTQVVFMPFFLYEKFGFPGEANLKII
jgi:hypothetical protein